MEKYFKSVKDEDVLTRTQKTREFVFRELPAFGYDSLKEEFDDLISEVKELEQELYKTNNEQRIMEESGDIIFVICMILNRFNIKANDAINYSTTEFQRRICYLEDNLKDKFKTATTKELLEMWKEAKKAK
jgi:tetrapyrrole methylase family protein/MazG family protein